MRDINNYKVFTKAHNLVLKIYKITNRFPKEEIYGLASQMRRSSYSIPMNLKEGGSGSELEVFRYVRIAYGSRLKFIHVFRDPVGNIYEQGRRNFETRIGTDSGEFQLTYECEGDIVLLIAEVIEEEYINGNPTERLVLLVDRLFRKNIKGYYNLDNK